MKKASFVLLKLALFLVILLFNINISYSQKFKIDSLENVLKKYKEDDTNKVNILNDLCWSYGSVQPDKAIEYGERSNIISQRINYKKGIAESYKNIGVVYYRRSDYKKALEYFINCNKYYKEIRDKNGEAKSLNNMGLAYKEIGDYGKSLKYYIQAIKILEELDDKSTLVKSLNNIGLLYQKQTNLPNYLDNALTYYHRALNIAETINDKNSIAFSYYNIGDIYINNAIAINNRPDRDKDLLELGKKSKEDSIRIRKEADAEAKVILLKALDYLNKSLKIRQEINDVRYTAITLSNIANVYAYLKDYDKALNNYMLAYKKQELIGDRDGITNSMFNIAVLYYKKKEFPLAIEYYSKSLAIAKQTRSSTLKDIYISLANLYENIGNYKLAYENQYSYSQIKDSLLNEETSKMITEMQTKYETEKKEKEIQILSQENKIKDLKITEQAIIRNSFIVGFVFVLLIAILIFNSYKRKKRDNQIISLEKAKTEKLLLNTLPAKCVSDLKLYGKTEPESFENVSVYFSDIVGFTTISSTLEPKKLINALSEMFTEFDDIMMRNSCERIKTIGDAYLAVCGMPEKHEDHAYNMVKSALEIRNYMLERNEKAEIVFRIRIGVNSGKVVGGIVGVKKYLYDVFGDSINTAARMESNSEPMRVNISEDTYKLVKDRFVFEERPITEIKGKGPMRMYFVEDFL
ncbi:MAG: hypothetical protein A2X12_05875 [Bacteroidetes bacterium GWE2_29_8]|nr:MAG: hypothetical protein A2X12_05875 [Bacteroidetes bacterium GWE2_29_8]OFY18745.1 MAG: hypothetical protein A2X02_04340 [Bacteroidetes bacterium GWF2_29_10]